MGIAKVKIENFRTIDRMNLDVKESGISCLLGKNGVGKTTIINAIRYLYKVAEHPYDIEQIIDKKNSYVQRTKIELVFDFTKLHKKTSNQYIEENLYDFKTYIKDNQLPLKMTQYKNGLVEWYPINDVYKVRRLLRVFPVYIVDTRDISLYPIKSPYPRRGKDGNGSDGSQRKLSGTDFGEYRVRLLEEQRPR